MKDFIKGWGSAGLDVVACVVLGAASFVAIEALMPTPSSATVPHEVIETCQKAMDFKGCADAVMNGVTPAEEKSELEQAMRKVSRRLQNGTNLRDSDEVFRPVIDAIANAPETIQQKPIFLRAKKAEALFNIAQQTWQYRINSMIIGSHTRTKQWMVRHCKQMAAQVNRFNAVAGEKLVTWRWQKNGIFGLCKFQTNPETPMVRAVAEVLLGESEPTDAKPSTPSER